MPINLSEVRIIHTYLQSSKRQVCFHSMGLTKCYCIVHDFDSFQMHKTFKKRSLKLTTLQGIVKFIHLITFRLPQLQC